MISVGGFLGVARVSVAAPRCRFESPRWIDPAVGCAGYVDRSRPDGVGIWHARVPKGQSCPNFQQRHRNKHCAARLDRSNRTVPHHRHIDLNNSCQAGNMSTSTVKRKQKLVDCEVQTSVLRKISIHWVVFFVCNAIALMIWIRLYEQPDANWGQTFGDTMRRFLPFFVITAALIPAFVWDTLKLTNRFAGPIMRLRGALAEASAGRSVKPLQFRNSDFWQEIAQDFNQMVDRQDLCEPVEVSDENGEEDAEEESSAQEN